MRLNLNLFVEFDYGKVGLVQIQNQQKTISSNCIVYIYYFKLKKYSDY